MTKDFDLGFRAGQEYMRERAAKALRERLVLSLPLREDLAHEMQCIPTIPLSEAEHLPECIFVTGVCICGLGMGQAESPE